MAAKKLKVIFVKRYEDRDKDGNKVVIEAGTKTRMTEAQIKKAGTKVRVIEEEQIDEQPDDDEEPGGDGATGD
ncbi:hypothetical protein MARINON1_52482 [Marinobacter salarius]|uniref:hypothetical protein n=1 Tax=Marinobacter salarius TaxID=1420917 RepID=UPI0012534CA0|nr:hypothetical protein [Marinobacter salarius]VVT02778.1 conserved hypothetical protein [Marinobacter salarius]VXC25103.1 hypothetical protein MARINON1_52482 [Marinobacter salarius]